MQNQRNYYRILHVQPDAPTAVIKASYRTMMQKLRHHPDLGGDEFTARLLNEAVSILCDDLARAAYDQARESQRSTRSQHAGMRSAGAGVDSAAGSSGGASPYDSDAGGRPNGPTDEPDEPDEPDDLQQSSSKYSAGEQSTKAVLPTRPHCPFCFAVYPARPAALIAGYDKTSSCLRCGGATTPIASLISSHGDELRQINRRDYQCIASIWRSWPLGTPITASVADLSLTGCALIANDSLARGDVILLTSAPLNAIGEVRYCNSSAHSAAYSIGLAFKTLKILAAPGDIFSVTA